MWYSSNKNLLHASPIRRYRMHCYKWSLPTCLYDVPGYNLAYFGIVVYEGEFENLYDIKIMDVDSNEFKSLSVDVMKMLLDNPGFRNLYCENRYLFSSKENMVVIDGRPLVKGKYVDHLCCGKVDVNNLDKTLVSHLIKRHCMMISMMSRHPGAMRSFEDVQMVRAAILCMQEPFLNSSVLKFDEKRKKLLDEISTAQSLVEMYKDSLNAKAEHAAESLDVLESKFGISMEI